MAKQSRFKIHSIQYENEKGELHVAVIHSSSADMQAATFPNGQITPPTGVCNCGTEQCINGIRYRCIKDPFGDCVWMKTSEHC